jgi:hypothetical protein
VLGTTGSETCVQIKGHAGLVSESMTTPLFPARTHTCGSQLAREWGGTFSMDAA